MGQWLYKPNDLFADPDQLDKLIDWRMESHALLKANRKVQP
jgi:hypothetical protein